ncbi:MAG TPA: DUF6089 family protein [Bacteroidia bacterium]|jgi:hypothetical protein|nr:DUF6089 family protein [Bacteroidia bacterium]
MKKIFLVLSTVFLGAISLYAQNSPETTEIGIFLGGSFYLGDLNPNGFFKFTQPAFGLIYRYNINNRFSARANVLIGEVTAYDNQSSSAYQQDRNLNFKSPIDEISGQIEFNFFEYEIGNPKYNFSPYIFGGFGFFRMNPQGKIGDQWVELQPLHTEGQGTQYNTDAPYHLIQPCIPFGIGIKTNFSPSICLSIEWGLRKTFTGYIDDVSGVYPNASQLAKSEGPNASLALQMSNRSNVPSAALTGTQRGNGKNDWYSFAGIILSFHPKHIVNECFSYF